MYLSRIPLNLPLPVKPVYLLNSILVISLPLDICRRQIARLFHGGCIPREPGPNIVGMRRHAKSEDTRLLGESGRMLPQKNFKKFENLELLEMP